jgi:hypothetical protein
MPLTKTKLQSHSLDCAWRCLTLLLRSQAVVTPAEAEAMARRLGLKFYRTCVRENLNVTEGEHTHRHRSMAGTRQPYLVAAA